MAERRQIDFAGLADELLRRGVSLIEGWLPGGVQRGHEYVCADLSGGAGTSTSINLKTGAWGDFAADICAEWGRQCMTARAKAGWL